MSASLSFRFTRLGLGEWTLGIGSALLLIDLFGLSWFEYRPGFHATAVMLGQRVSANGWQSFEVIGPLALAVCCAGIVICYLVASRRSPSLPVVLTTLLVPVAIALAVLVAVRVLLAQPTVHLAQAGGANVIETQPGAYVGLVLTVVVAVGAYLALRRESVAPEDSPSPAAVESIRVDI